MAVTTTEFKGIGSMFPLFTKTDLAKRWGITLNRLNNWEVRHDDFPPRIAGIIAGDLVVYAAADVRTYEDKRGGAVEVAGNNAALGNRK